MITITSEAAKQLRDLVSEKKISEDGGLRLSIEQGGCAGLQYAMTLGTAQPEDKVIEQENAHVFIDAASFDQLAGCTIDYETGLTGSGFRIINPRAVRSCGCGTSFEPQKK